MKPLIYLIIAFIFTSCSNVSRNIVSQPADNGRVAEITFGDRATLSGRIEQIKTYDNDGRAVFPYYIYTNSPIIVRADGGYDPGDTNEELDGMEVKMLGMSDDALARYRGKTVVIRGHVSGDLDLHCFSFGLFVSSLRDITTQ